MRGRCFIGEREVPIPIAVLHLRSLDFGKMR